ncbi:MULTISPECIES: BadF/BadG/BcrA/BcrD ATPase family protein [Rufibacter]|uniref:N-acetylglucosamine kinase-like BadF-type ATPase n=1 Tax=Rufibacter quisquiliarum TaxID=1549639 RepID=A0A839GDF5_9BACT|nr:MULTISPECIES: BadF/BadG/BcrA/BcrD ATPase family protein [Rufibacter]MBA9077624.1 N-acetylglucosamine kinase-like BadF-type ATPase [Rufibacter quisquiliarum]
MILIADSGSTKTSWRLLTAEGEVAQAHTIGINPYYQESAEITQSLQESLLPQLPQHMPEEIYFYGAGCSAKDKQEVVASALRALFPSSDVSVHHDLEAAARALCGHEEGIACILGTGSNSCHYDGEKIVESMPNLGFILGDEGSGGYMGKLLVQAYLNLELPQDLHQAFFERYQVGRDEIIDQVYRKPYPNRYMAGFAKFMHDHRNHPYLYQMIFKCFADFFEKTVTKYPDYQQRGTHFVGSIAFYFSDILRTVAQQYHINVKNILESPIAGLSLYHQQKITV